MSNGTVCPGGSARGRMRRGFFLIPILALALAAPRGVAGTVEEWLDIAADARTETLKREFAARQIILLADVSANILVAALKDAGPDHDPRRRAAAKILAEIAPPEAEAALLETAFGPDPFLAESARSALERIYAKLPDNAIYTLLTRGAGGRGGITGGAAPAGGDDWLALSLEQSGRRGAFKALVMGGLARKYAANPGELPLPLTWRVMDGLLDADADLRLAAVKMLPHVADPGAVRELAALLYSENSPKILIAALRVMARLRPPAYGEAVERHAAHADPLVALAALAALDAMGYPAAMLPGAPGARSLAGFVNHPSTPARRRAIEILVAGGKPEALPYLEAALFDRVPANRALAARGLGEMGLTAAIGALNPLLRDGRPEVRREAAVALARLGVLGVAAGRLDDLESASPPFRLAAAEALGRIGDRRAVPGLLEAAKDGKWNLRFAAIAALGRLGDARAKPLLFDILRDREEPALSDCARRSLLAISGEDPGADPDKWEGWFDRNRLPAE